MNTCKVVLAALLVSVTIFSCATGPSFEEFQSDVQEIPDDHGRIVFYRLSGSADTIRPS
jgi:hypothetical protein